MKVKREKRSPHTDGAFFFLIKTVGGFSLIELIVTLSILGLLSVIVTPIYTKWSANAKIARSKADLESIKRAFVSYYYESMIAGHPEFPPAPADSLMTHDWANTHSLAGGKTPASLFSEGRIPMNPMDNYYKYGRLEDTGGIIGGFILRDPDIGTWVTFQP